MRNAALIGKGYWGTKLLKYATTYFNMKYIADSKFDKNTIWDDQSVEAVIIATPIKTHFNVVRNALLHGKHVFVEKPITDDPAQAVELLELSEELGLKVFVDYTLIFSKSVQEAVKLSKRFGELKHMELYSTKFDNRGIDVYWSLGSHLLSIVDLFIPLKSACFSAVNHLYCKGKCSTGYIIVGDDLAHINVSLGNPNRSLGFQCYFDYGFIACNLDGTHPSLYAYENDSNHDILSEYSISYDEKNNIDFALQAFCDVLDGKCASNIDMAVQVTKIIKGFEK